MKISELMSKDHEKISLLLEKLDANLGDKNVYSSLHQALAEHFIIEEIIINEVFKRGSRKSLLPIAESLQREHKEMLDMIAKNSSPKELIHILRHHKNVEDNLFYPKLDETLSQEEKSAIRSAIKR